MFRLQTARALAILALVVTSVSGCGSDSVANGPFLVGSGADGAGGDGGGLGDGTGSPDSGITGTDGGDIAIVPGPDSSNPGDAPLILDLGPNPDTVTPVPDGGGPDPGGSCTGICGKYVKGATCHCDGQCEQFGDCCGDYAVLCGGPNPGNCGNGTCDGGETASNCAQDCGANPGEVISCLKQKCQDDIKFCQTNATCAKVVACVEQCKSEACADACSQNVSDKIMEMYLQPLGLCGVKVGCISDPPQALCGDGLCDSSESDLSCPEDCKGPPPMAFCGDGKCNGGETSATCAQDCGNVAPPAGAIAKCLAGKCGDVYQACTKNAGCQKVLDCAASCADFSCMAACAQVTDIATQQKFVLPLGQCGQNAGCFDTAPTTTCGDGKCNGSENAVSCPKDCKTVTNPTEQCLADKCGKVWTPCAANAECYAAAQCLQKGGSVFQCVKNWQVGQMLNSVVMCGNQNKCLTGPAPVSSCQGKCGQYDPKASCQCDNVCKQMGNCCGDYATYCGATPAKCGDGKCDVVAGEPKTCPTDCGPPPPVKCATKGDCAADEVCCAKPDGQMCVKLGQCN